MSDMASQTTDSRKPLDSYKRDAARLLKAARAADPAAIQRFARLDHPPADLHLKHALAVVALEAGHPGWTALKQAHDNGPGVDFSELFGDPGLRDSLNHWYASYDEAKAHQTAHGGVLLPYRHHCFVTSLDVLPRLGFDRDDPDWRDIAYDFVRPASAAADARIRTRLSRRFAKA